MVIFSCVRAHGRGAGVGFLADVRRMNVGLTRARHALWILGHSSTLQVRAGCKAGLGDTGRTELVCKVGEACFYWPVGMRADVDV